MTTQANPWSLTLCEQQAIDAVAITGSPEGGANLLKLNSHVMYSRLRHARMRMGADSLITAVLLWDRFAFGREGT